MFISGFDHEVRIGQKSFRGAARVHALLINVGFGLLSLSAPSTTRKFSVFTTCGYCIHGIFL